MAYVAAHTEISDGDPRVRRSLSCLEHELTYGDPATRESAARELGEYGGEAVEPLLSFGIRDADRGVQTAAALSLLAIAPDCEFTFPEVSTLDPAIQVLATVMEARRQGNNGVKELETALHYRDPRQREAAFRAFEILLRGIEDSAQRRPYLDLAAHCLHHRQSGVRRGVLGLMRSVPMPEALPALLSRLQRTRRVDNNLVGTVLTWISSAFWFAGMTRILFSVAGPPLSLSDLPKLISSVLVFTLLIVFPIAVIIRLRRKWLGSSAELLETLVALENQGPALPDTTLRDLKSIATNASGHSEEARFHARELIQRFEAAKSQHGPLPIPATAVEAAVDSLPLSGG